MTDTYRALCEQLMELAEGKRYDGSAVIAKARAALAQPEPVAPTDEELLKLLSCVSGLPDNDTYIVDGGRIMSEPNELLAFARAIIAKWGNSQGILDSSPQPVWADIHYAWELEDADGEWQAGGSANNLEDVQREGNRYLQTYAQDGPHKLIIQRHCVNTIEEALDD
jgi:hypothetical protein